MSTKQLRISKGSILGAVQNNNNGSGAPIAPRLQYQDGKLVTNSQVSMSIQLEQMEKERRNREFASRFNSRKTLMTIPMPTI